MGLDGSWRFRLSILRSIAALSSGAVPGVGPFTARRPILLPPFSVNQRLPSGPAVIQRDTLPAVGTTNSVMMPAGVLRPILLPCLSANQRLPSGPAAIPLGKLLVVGTVNSVMTPAGVIRPI